ncbi:hypothetical protein GGR57DRAFT_460923 [Xylariaceae sp. FL1272]|nr:hypothetical protein GGR57DRAFT_460923 [Xylariaceae sp. FL1272]
MTLTESTGSVLTTGSTDAVTGTSSSPSLSVPTSSTQQVTTCVAGYGDASVCFTITPSSTNSAASSVDPVTNSIPTTFATSSIISSILPSSTSSSHTSSPTYPTNPFPGNSHDHGSQGANGQEHGGGWNWWNHGNGHKGGWKRFLAAA